MLRNLGNSKRIYQTGNNRKTLNPAFRLGTTIGGYHSWHGGTVLFVICISLYIRSACRRTHGKLQHHRRFSPSACFISNHFPQETHHQSNGELHCRTVL